MIATVALSATKLGPDASYRTMAYPVVLKRRIPILMEYERTRANKERRYYAKRIEGNKTDESLLPKKQGARPGSSEIIGTVLFNRKSAIDNHLKGSHS